MIYAFISAWIPEALNIPLGLLLGFTFWILTKDYTYTIINRFLEKLRES